MSMGQKQSDYDRMSQGYNTGKAMWQQGQTSPFVSSSKLDAGANAGWMDAQEAYDQRLAQQHHYEGWMREIMSQSEQSQGPSYEQQMADQKSAYEAQMAEQQRIQGLNDRDKLFGNYMDAAGSATDYINNQIDQEKSNANLLGIDHEISDEQKSTRISDYFASIWGAGDQSSLEGLMSKWGNPTGFTGFSVVRGDGSKYAGEKTTGGETLATSKGLKPQIQKEEDPIDFLGSVGSALGI